jgi:hypothetical protein
LLIRARDRLDVIEEDYTVLESDIDEALEVDNE